MKKLLIIFITLFSNNIVQAQTDNLADLEPYFTAFIVENIEHSIGWYTQTLGFEVTDKREFKDAGFKQANLKRQGILIELIELEHSITPSNAIQNYTSKTRIKGIFKVGFKLSDFDTWMDRLTELEVNFRGNVVQDNITGKKMIIIMDPDGNRIQLFEK